MFEFLPVQQGILAASLALSLSSPALAGGKALACYQQVHQPAVYKTVHQQVVVRPGGVVHETIPARYAKVTEKVLVEPERLVARHIPAVVKTVHQTVMVRPKSIGWEWRKVHGVKTLCKVDAFLPIRHPGPGPWSMQPVAPCTGTGALGPLCAPVPAPW